MNMSQSETEESEEMTRKQIDCPAWHKLRPQDCHHPKSRIKDFETLTDRLTSLRNILTHAMKRGIDGENSTQYNVNVNTCDF